MKKTIRTLLAAFGLACAAAALAAEGGIAWDKAPGKLSDQAALQRGAKLFVDYCLGCHSASFMRYNRLTEIGLTEAQIKQDYLFSAAAVGNPIVSAIDPKQAKEWFGKAPPDLTLIARSRAGAGGSGADYLYTFLRTFYVDESKPTGWDNLAFPTVGMPHVLWELQGLQKPVFGEGHAFKGWQQISPGRLDGAGYDDAVADLVAFLQWLGEPAQATRRKVGAGVLVFMLFAVFVTWRLSKSFWREVK